MSSSISSLSRPPVTSSNKPQGFSRLKNLFKKRPSASIRNNRVTIKINERDFVDDLIDDKTIERIIHLEESRECHVLIQAIIRLLNNKDAYSNNEYVLGDIEESFKLLITKEIITNGGRSRFWESVETSFFNMTDITDPDEKESITKLANFIDTISSSWFLFTLLTSCTAISVLLIEPNYPYDATVTLLRIMGWMGYNIGNLIVNIARYQAPTMVTSSVLTIIDSPNEVKQFIITLFFTYFGRYFGMYLNLETIQDRRDKLRDFRTFQCAFGWYSFFKKNMLRVNLTELRSTNPAILNDMAEDLAAIADLQSSVDVDNLTNALENDESAQITLRRGLRHQTRILRNRIGGKSKRQKRPRKRRTVRK